MAKRTAVACAAVLAIAGCGGDDEGGEPARTQPPAQTETVAPEDRTRPAPDETAPAGDDDEEQIRAVWRRYTEALGEEDAATVCSLLTENGQEEVLRGGSPGSTCEEIVREIGSYFKEFRTELTDIRVQGDAAEAVTPLRGQIPAQGLKFVRVGGKWKLDGASDLE